jgi:hypothetical protein
VLFAETHLTTGGTVAGASEEAEIIPLAENEGGFSIECRSHFGQATLTAGASEAGLVPKPLETLKEESAGKER